MSIIDINARVGSTPGNQPECMRLILENELHLWYAKVRKTTPAQAERILSMLSDAERIRYGKLQDAGKRDEFLATRALVRSSLSRYLSLHPSELHFDIDRHGKPSLNSSCGLEFNLSNTHELAVCLISSSGPAGIDIEGWKRGADILEVAERFLSHAEQEELSSLEPALRPDRAISLWTLKEAYLKAIGTGLTADPQRVGFLYEGFIRPRLHVDPSIDARPARWHFYVGDLMRHRIALAVPFPFREYIRIFEANQCDDMVCGEGDS